MASWENGWYVDGVALSEQLMVLRRARRDLVLFLPTLGAAAMPALGQLADALRQAWCLTATVVVAATDTQHTRLRHLGITAAADYRSTAPSADHDWIVTTSPHDWPAWRTIGPGGDVDITLAELARFGNS